MALASQLALDRENGKRSTLGKSSNHRLTTSPRYMNDQAIIYERINTDCIEDWSLHDFCQLYVTSRQLHRLPLCIEKMKREKRFLFWRGGGGGLNPFVPSWSVAKEIESSLQVQDLGGLVWHYDSQLKPGEANKFHHQWEGPYEIVELVTDVTFSVKNARGCSRKSQVAHISNLQLYK